MTAEELGRLIAQGIAETGIEGIFSSLSCSTGGDYPSLGLSQWEGPRAESLLLSVPGGEAYTGMSYSMLKSSGSLGGLSAFLASPAGQSAQRQLLASDCAAYGKALLRIPGFTALPSLVYAGMWCPTSLAVVTVFLTKRIARYDLNDLQTIHRIFRKDYARAADCEEYLEGYQNRADCTLIWVRSHV